MNILQIIQSEYISLLAGGIAGIVTAWLTQRVINKSGTFSYVVNHQRVGMSAEDEIFGSVKVTWNEKTISNLYLSTVDFKNESQNDYENVIVKTYTSDTSLLTEQTQIIDSPNILDHSEKYKNQLIIPDGEEPTDVQLKLYNGQREHIIPIFNRGQSIRLVYLNSAKTNEQPNIFLSVSKKGVKLKLKTPQNMILGEQQPRAAFAGLLLGIVIISSLILFIDSIWIIAITAFIYGLMAQMPGAYAIKAFRFIRELIGG